MGLGLHAFALAQHEFFPVAKVVVEPEVIEIMAEKWNDAFQPVVYPKQWLDDVYSVNPGESIQSAIDAASVSGGVVLLKEGVHVLEQTITLKGKVTLIGEGRERTVLMRGNNLSGVALHVAPTASQVTDLVIKNFSLKGTPQDVKTNALLIAGNDETKHARIALQNLRISHWSGTGVHIKHSNHIVMDDCIVQYNGSFGSLWHNVYFLFNKHILQSDCDMSFPTTGKGCKYTSTQYVIAQRCTIRDSKVNGIQSDHAETNYLFFHKYNISGCGWVALWFPCEDYFDKYNYTEDLKFAPQKVILNRCSIVDNTWGAMWRAVEDSHVINCVFDNRQIDMGLLKCELSFEGSQFWKGNETYTDVKQWPKEVKILW